MQKVNTESDFPFCSIDRGNYSVFLLDFHDKMINETGITLSPRVILCFLDYFVCFYFSSKMKAVPISAVPFGYTPACGITHSISSK